jgi:hypothetical protein
MSQESVDDDLFEKFTQFSQKCTICLNWLLVDEDTLPDPDNKWHVVHATCVHVCNKRKRSIQCEKKDSNILKQSKT